MVATNETYGERREMAQIIGENDGNNFITINESWWGLKVFRSFYISIMEHAAIESMPSGFHFTRLLGGSIR